MILRPLWLCRPRRRPPARYPRGTSRKTRAMVAAGPVCRLGGSVAPRRRARTLRAFPVLGPGSARQTRVVRAARLRSFGAHVPGTAVVKIVPLQATGSVRDRVASRIGTARLSYHIATMPEFRLPHKGRNDGRGQEKFGSPRARARIGRRSRPAPAKNDSGAGASRFGGGRRKRSAALLLPAVPRMIRLPCRVAGLLNRTFR